MNNKQGVSRRGFLEVIAAFAVGSVVTGAGLCLSRPREPESHKRRQATVTIEEPITITVAETSAALSCAPPKESYLSKPFSEIEEYSLKENESFDGLTRHLRELDSTQTSFRILNDKKEIMQKVECAYAEISNKQKYGEDEPNWVRGRREIAESADVAAIETFQSDESHGLLVYGGNGLSKLLYSCEFSLGCLCEKQ